MIKFNPDQKVSAYLALSLILILSFLTAWFTISTSQEIIDNSRESPVFNIEKRTQKAIPKDNLPVRK